MSKNILIFSDGTGQIGGQRPDQRLSNVYKMYRAMRPGPDSPVKPSDQVAYYDPGLGSGETDGLTFRKVRNGLEAGVGSGIDENIIDCYEKIISYYEPGDQVLVFGFSRGAYTARSVANVMNLCGVPTQMPDGSPMPKQGPALRKIASDAVKYVYNHGAGKPRSDDPYFTHREEKARRFRKKYGSNAEGEKAAEQGNIQPTFIGVFDTVAALGNVKVNILVYGSFAGLILLNILGWLLSWSLSVKALLAGVALFVLYWGVRIFISQFKYFSPDPDKPLRFSNPFDWIQIWRNGHRAVWSSKNYDKFLDSDVRHARHALAIDENRADFPRVKWASKKEEEKTKGRKPQWLKQVWFAGCHSDVGGSYPEPESRLSDIALQWMVDELRECVPSVIVREELLVTSPDPLALQHEEKFFLEFGPIKIKWRQKPRIVPKDFPLHPSVLQRFKATQVPQAYEVKVYRPPQLADHSQTKGYYTGDESSST